jgi:hypothetical protein
MASVFLDGEEFIKQECWQNLAEPSFDLFGLLGAEPAPTGDGNLRSLSGQHFRVALDGGVGHGRRRIGRSG